MVSAIGHRRHIQRWIDRRSQTARKTCPPNERCSVMARKKEKNKKKSPPAGGSIVKPMRQKDILEDSQRTNVLVLQQQQQQRLRLGGEGRHAEAAAFQRGESRERKGARQRERKSCAREYLGGPCYCDHGYEELREKEEMDPSSASVSSPSSSVGGRPLSSPHRLVLRVLRLALPIPLSRPPLHPPRRRLFPILGEGQTEAGLREREREWPGG